MRLRDDFCRARRLRRLWLSVMVMLSLCILLGINGLAAKFHRRFGSSSRTTPSKECIAQARSLGESLQLYVVYDDADGFEDATSLRTALQIFLENTRTSFSAAGVPFDYDFLHRLRHGARLEQWFASAFPKIPPTSGIFLRSGNRIQGVPASACYVLRNGEVRGFSLGPALLEALRAISDPIPPTVYFLRNHGERSLQQRYSDGGLARLRQWIERQGWRAEPLDGDGLEKVDSAHGFLAIIDPRLPLRPREQVALQNFFEERGGRVLLVLTPESHGGLADFLFHWNVLAEDALKIATSSDGDDDISICHFAREDFLQSLIDYQMPVHFASVRPIREDIGGPGGAALRVTSLMETTATTLSPPFSIAVAVQKKMDTSAPIDQNPWKMAIIGGDFLSNRLFSLPGNQLLFQQLAFYLLDRKISSPLPPIDEFQLHLSKSEMGAIARTILFATLLFPSMLGLFHFLRRKF
ncbi:MAG: GldG family protein [Puniceicoccales bacterium]|jgi:hypothetical protein|nr:GldG family protein [Puniceicoccales bacterium]